MIIDLPKVPREDQLLPLETQVRELREWCEQMRENTLEILRAFDREMQRKGQPVELPAATVADLAAGVKFRAGFANRMVQAIDETGGTVPAFSDGSDWLRVTDRAVVS